MNASFQGVSLTLQTIRAEEDKSEVRHSLHNCIDIGFRTRTQHSHTAIDRDTIFHMCTECFLVFYIAVEDANRYYHTIAVSVTCAYLSYKPSMFFKVASESTDSMPLVLMQCLCMLLYYCSVFNELFPLKPVVL